MPPRATPILCSLSLLLAAMASAQAVRSHKPSLRPIALRVSGLTAPIGLPDQRPFFAWQLDPGVPTRHDVAQSAYRILVASSAPRLQKRYPDVWDSGRIHDRNYTHATYAGPPLQSHTTYFWKVCIWESGGSRSTCSSASQWTTALLHPEEWVAKWIAARPDTSPPPPAREGVGDKHQTPDILPLFRHSFALFKPIKQAVVFVAGLGQYELHLNGHTITDQVMTPGWTDYRKTVLYNTFDITTQLHPGDNVLGLMLGNGMYKVPGVDGRYTKLIGSFGIPKTILQLHVTFDDGTQQIIASDNSWQTAPGPISFSSIYGGEDFDARNLPDNWDGPAPAGSWTNAIEAAAPSGSTTPGDSLVSLLIPPMKILQVIPPVHVSEVRPGRQIYDLGTNFSGWPEIRVEGHAGDIIRMLPGEILDSSGNVTQQSIAASDTNAVYFAYTLRGGGPETWHPRFTYQGFRYVQVDTTPAHQGAAPPKVLSLVGDFVHDDVPVDGHFHSSIPLLNDIHHLIDQAILSNLASVLTDCPTREKLGWLEQTYLNAGSIMYNYGTAQLYRKIGLDIADAQLPNGLVPSIAPEYVAFIDGNGTSTAFRDSPEWGSAIILSQWDAYQFYGDLNVLQAHYDSMTRYAAYLKTRLVDGLLSFGLGDWYDIGPGAPGHSKLTGESLTATATYYQDLVTLARIASLLSKQDDSARYSADANEVRTAFNRALYHPETKTYDRGSQTANAMPLYLGLVPDQDRAAVLANLVADIRAYGNHVTAGDIGFHYLVGALLQSGRSDVLYDMVMRTDSPSYGYQLSRGATSLTEAWDANPSSSQNHFMLGHAEEWFYRGLAGIDFDLSRETARRLLLHPAMDSGAPDASATLNTILGTISSTWQRNDTHWSATFSIPAGTTATLILPTGALSRTPAAGNKQPGSTPGTEDWLVGSGTYSFTGRFQLARAHKQK